MGNRGTLLGECQTVVGSGSETGGFYVGADYGVSWLEPENDGGCYVIDDELKYEVYGAGLPDTDASP